MLRPSPHSFPLPRTLQLTLYSEVVGADKMNDRKGRLCNWLFPNTMKVAVQDSL